MTLWRWMLVLAAVLSISGGCSHPGPEPSAAMPSRFIWAWERPEDLRFLDAREYGVAYLAQTLTLLGDEVVRAPRRQPLFLPQDAYIIAVTRIESGRRAAEVPTLSANQRKKIVEIIRKSVELPGIRGVQIDFDAGDSQREFYRQLLQEVRASLPRGTYLSVTALASWCSGDRWLNDVPIDEAVPMFFDMGRDGEEVMRSLNSGTDWPEPLCRLSYGLSIESATPDKLAAGRRTYFFKSSAWRENDLSAIQQIVSK